MNYKRTSIPIADHIRTKIKHNTLSYITTPIITHKKEDMSGIEAAERGTLSPEPKQVTNEAIKETKAAHGLFTPESTPGPENARIEADKERRKFEATQIARIEAEKNRRQTEATKELSSQPDLQQALNKEHLATETGQFADDAQGDGHQGYENDVVMLEASDAPKPDDFRRQIYKAAEPSLATLMMSPEDAGAITRLKRLNEQIQEQNLKEKKNPHDFLIKYETFIAHFVMAKPYYESLQKNPDGEHARKKLMVINETLSGLNKRHDYPKTWMITIPSRTTDEIDKALARDGVKAPAGGGVKAKVSICIPDESNGRTSLGYVVCVRKLVMVCASS